MKKFFCSLISVLVFVLTLPGIQTTYAIGGLSEFTQTNTDYFGDSNNWNTDDMIVYNSKIYISHFSVTGTEIWEYDGTTWTQSNTDGFGDSANLGTDNFIVHNSKLYVGTTGNATGVEVWEYNGTAWARVNTDGFGDAANTRVNNDMVIYNSELYAAATNNGSGVEIWKYNDVGTSWTMVNTNGFGNANNLSIYDMGVYNSKLYAGTYQNGGSTEIWTCTTCDGSDWTQTSTDGFGDANNTRIHEFIVYGSKLYVPTYNTSTGTEIWELDVASWSQVNTNGFGDANNDSILNSFLYDSNLYFGTSNWNTGTEVWQYDGTTFTQINTNGFGDVNNTDFTSSTEYAGNLYGGIYNGVTGVEIWRYNDTGTSWTQVNEDGFGGGSDNAGITANIALLGSSIHVASGTASVVPRTWETHTASTDLALTNTIDNAAPEVGETVTYTLTVTNSGPDGATLVEVTDLLPAGLTYSSDTPSQGTYTSGTGIWDVGSVTNGNNATLTISATVTAAIGETVSNSAEITDAAEADPDSTVNNDTASEDDQASVDFTVPSIDLALTMSVDNSTPHTGNAISYTLTLINNGPESATSIQVTDTLSSDTSYTSSIANQGTYDGDTGVWTVGTLANGAQTLLIINVTVTGSVTGTIITNSAEVTSVTETDSDSTPNNDVSSEDDQASAGSTLADPALAGSSTFISSGGGSSGTTVKTLSGESEEEVEEEIEEPEEEVEETEEKIEEPEEEPEEEPTEEKLEEEKDILEEATKTVTTTVTEIVYTEPTPPAPPAPQPPIYQPPAPPTPQPTESTIFESEEITSAIEEYENKIATTEEIAQIYKPIKEVIEENAGQESIDSDKDGVSDLFQLSRGIPLNNDNPDNDDYSNSTEFYCDLNPLEPDVLENTPKIPTLKKGVTTGSNIAIRICSGTTDDAVDVMLVEKEDTTSQIYIGQTKIDEGNKGIILLREPLEDGEYYILAKGKEGMGKVTSFEVQNSIVPQAPVLKLTNEKKELGKTVRFVITFNGKIFKFDSEKFIANNTISKIEGTSKPGLIAYATWQSRILSSVVISDASQGEFVLEIPADLPEGEHEILVYLYNEEDNLISNITSLLFPN